MESKGPCDTARPVGTKDPLGYPRALWCPGILVTLWGLMEPKGTWDTIGPWETKGSQRHCVSSWFSVSSDACVCLQRGKTGQPEPVDPKYSHVHGTTFLPTVVLCVLSALCRNCILQETPTPLAADTAVSPVEWDQRHLLLCPVSQSPSNPARDASKHGASNKSLGNLCRCFTTLSIQNFFLISSLNLFLSALKPFPLL